MVKSGDSVLNVGSQTGFEALQMGKQVGPNGKVYVFEPYSFSYRIMRKSVYLNGMEDRVHTFNLGASNSYEVGTISVKYLNTGGS